jgi:hypothetical protein
MSAPPLSATLAVGSVNQQRSIARTRDQDCRAASAAFPMTQAQRAIMDHSVSMRRLPTLSATTVATFTPLKMRSWSRATWWTHAVRRYVPRTVAASWRVALVLVVSIATMCAPLPQFADRAFGAAGSRPQMAQSSVATNVGHLCGNIATGRTLSPAVAKVYVIDCSVTIPTKVIVTLAPDVIIKVRSGTLTVNGTLRSTATSLAPAILTSYLDDSAGGDTNGGPGTPLPRSWNLSIAGRGQLALDHTDLRYGTIATTGNASAYVATVTNSTLRKAAVTVTRPGTVKLQSNVLVGSQVDVAGVAAPVVRSNRFVGTASPLNVIGVGDLAGVGANSASGSPIQRVFTVSSSTVASSWTVDPATSAVYVLEAVTVASGAVMTVSPGAIVKFVVGPDEVDVQGSLQVSGSASAPVILTSWLDDTAGGDSNNDGTRSVPTGSEYIWIVEPGAVVSVDHVDARYGDVGAGFASTPPDGRSLAVTVTNSTWRDGRIQVQNVGSGMFRLVSNTLTRSGATASGGQAIIQSNVLVGSQVDVAGVAAPVVRSNRFVGTASPLNVIGVGDLAGVGANSASGSPIQRVFTVSSSTVASSWTVDPATSAIYQLQNLTIADGGTLTASAGAIVKGADTGLTIDVENGGVLNASNTTFTSAADDSAGGDTNDDGNDSAPGSWSGIRAEFGSTITIDGGALTHALIGIDANPGQEVDLLTPFASVQATNMHFSANDFDIRNGYKDWEHVGKAVDATGSSVDPALVSSHEHLCIPTVETDPPLPVIPIKIWDVKFGLLSFGDEKCPPVDYVEEKAHP